MSESLFDTFGVNADDVEVPSGGPKPGTYDAILSKVETKVGTKKDETAINLILSYKIDDYEYPIQQYFGLPKTKAPWDDTTVIRETTQGRKVTEKSDNDYKLGLIKKQLLALGVPESRVNQVKPEDLVGVPVVLTLVQNGQYVNLARTNGVVAKKEQTQTLPVPTAPEGFKPAWG